MNPNFADGDPVPDLVRSGILHPETERIFHLHKAEDSLAGDLAKAIHVYQNRELNAR